MLRYSLCSYSQHVANAQKCSLIVWIILNHVTVSLMMMC